MSRPPQSPEIEAKLALRTAMKARRSALDPAQRAAGARRIAEWGAPMLATRAGQTVSGFLSIGDELDTAPLLAALHAAGHPLCLPVMQGRGKPLIFRAWQPGDALATTVWGIREPLADRPERVPDTLLVPLLAFDRAGFRLGYGGGYYDRTIRLLHAGRTITAIGLAFDIQEIDAVPHLDYDERLDWVLTPSGPIRCQS